MQKIVVQMKDELEKIKEQLLNIHVVGKLIVISAPSGAGKTSIVHYLLEKIQ